MGHATYDFDRFRLDTAQRQLSRDGSHVELNARYLDALILLVADGGALVTKERFLAEVWHGVPVTDEALTQCIRTLRRALGDDAAAPRFIATVPKHGYRFVAPVTNMASEPASPVAAQPATASAAALTLVGALGGAAAGAIGGVIYGFTFDAQPDRAGIGAASVLLVLLAVCALVGALGGAGVGGGIAMARRLSGQAWRWAAVGAGLGGLAVGAIVKLLGTDAFHLLIGHAPGDVTGAVEGLVLGAAVGLGGWIGSRFATGPRIAMAAASGGVAGAAIGSSGGRLMGGSLDLLAHGFADSRLRMDQVGRLLGEAGFGPVTATVTGALEGALFAACVVGALHWAMTHVTVAGITRRT